MTVFDVVEHKSATWLVMELLEGETLSEILNRVERMDAEDAVMLLIPAMRGVAAAHAHGVVHRDLKPDNIFICRASDGQRREAKVLDFGVSKLSDEAGGEQVSITVTGNLVGTPTYMAPEQVRGNKVVDPRSDVYSLGVVLYQMLAGRPPFHGQVYSALMIEIATADPPRLRSFRPDLSSELEEIVHRAMARDLDRRYPDVTTFVHALENLIGLDSGQVVGRMQALHSEPIMLRTDSAPMPVHCVTPIGTASALASAVLSKEDTNTLELARQRGRRIRLIAISIGAAVLIAFGIKVIVTSSAHRSMEAVEEQRPVELRHQPAAPAVKAPAAAATPEPAPTAAVTVPETAAIRARRSAGRAGRNHLAHQRGHMKLSVSKIERTSERPSERSNDSASDHAAKASEKAAPTAAAPAPETARPGTTTPPPAPTAPAAPASRAGKISIDDF